MVSLFDFGEKDENDKHFIYGVKSMIIKDDINILPYETKRFTIISRLDTCLRRYDKEKERSRAFPTET